MPPFALLDLNVCKEEEQAQEISEALMRFLQEQDGTLFTITGIWRVPDTVTEFIISQIVDYIQNEEDNPILNSFVKIFFSTVATELKTHGRVEMTLDGYEFCANNKVCFEFPAQCDGPCKLEKERKEFAIHCRDCRLDYCHACVAQWEKDHSLFEINSHCLSLLKKQ